jgi:hypothetical protein
MPRARHPVLAIRDNLGHVVVKLEREGGQGRLRRGGKTYSPATDPMNARTGTNQLELVELGS